MIIKINYKKDNVTTFEDYFETGNNSKAIMKKIKSALKEGAEYIVISRSDPEEVKHTFWECGHDAGMLAAIDEEGQKVAGIN